MSETSVKQRLIQYLGYKSMGQNKFERLAGLSNGYISNLKANPSPEKLTKILNVSCDLNRDWLLYGEGEMLCENKASYGNNEDVAVPKSAEPDFKLVPLINIDSVGGMHSANMLASSEQYIIRMIPFTEARKGDIAIIQSGNSMTPTIPPGSVLLLREVPDWREYFGYGSIFVLWLKDGRRITKEIRRYEDDAKNYVWCVSHNPDVADEELPKSFINGVWKVIKFQADFGW